MVTACHDVECTQTQALRRTFAYGEVFMGMVMFLLFFLALAYVSPFAPDFDMVAMFRKSNSVRLPRTRGGCDGLGLGRGPALGTDVTVCVSCANAPAGRSWRSSLASRGAMWARATNCGLGQREDLAA